MKIVRPKIQPPKQKFGWYWYPITAVVSYMSAVYALGPEYDKYFKNKQ